MTGRTLTRGLIRKAGRDRLVVGGVDVTYFRDKTTPTPSYTLTEPFAYGACSLDFPQIDAAHESGSFGAGELAWVREGARVVISRVFEDASETVDYVGRVISIDPSGRVLNLGVGGEFSGPAGLLDEQNQMFRYRRDVGQWASLAARAVGVSFSPVPGPTTGIRITHTGGQSLLSWAQYVCAMSQDSNGVQRALMPTTWGSRTWQFAQKDYTTRHLTVFNDDARVVVDVTRDASEAPNVIYGTGITPDGERITNAKWPGVFSGPAPDYPMAGPFGLGTTDADTISGDGITVLTDKLRQMRYVPYDAPSPDTYTAQIVAGVKLLQKAAGQSRTGVMNLAAWNALYDNAVTGWTINGAYIAPLAEDDRVRQWNRSSNGALLGRNPLYDRTVLRVERTIDFGTGITKTAMIGYAQGILARSANFKNFVGRISLNGAGGFTGEHTSDADREALTSAAIAAYRDIRPGQNVWVPDFDGGTQFHISGVDITDTGAVLTVDTQARDLVEVAQIRTRNRESRRDIRREFFGGNRPAKPSTAMVACDEDFGILDRNHRLKGGQWNKIAVLAGQHGQVNRVRIQTVNNKAEFAVAVTSRDYGEKWFAHNVGNPMVPGATSSVWQKPSLADEFENRRILYAIGSAEDPCGYSTSNKYNTDGTAKGDPLTGILIDDSPWPYINAAHTAVIVYLWIYPDRDCTLKRGRVLYPQLDDAAA